MEKHNDWTEYLKDALQNAELPVDDSGWAHRTISAQQASSGRITGAPGTKGLKKRRVGGWTIGSLAAAAAIALCALLWHPGATAPDGLTADSEISITEDSKDGLTAGLTKGLGEDHKNSEESIAANSAEGRNENLSENLSKNLSKEQTGAESLTASSFNNPYLAIASDIREESDDNCPDAVNPINSKKSDEVETDSTVRGFEEELSVPDCRSENEKIDDRLAVNNDISAVSDDPTAGDNDIPAVSDDPAAGDNDIPAVSDDLATGDNDVPAVSDDPAAWNYDIDSRRADRDRRKVSIGLSGSMGSATSAGSSGLGLFAFDRDVSNPQNPSWDDIYAYNIGSLAVGSHNTNATDNFNHRQPVTFALTVGLPLNERFSLASGIQYSRVQSTFHSTGKDVEQELNYLGIPLQAQYRLTGNGLFRTYAAAGVLGEKLVGGYIGDKRLTDEKMQMSLSASLGARVQLWRDFSLRLEPGIRYYLTDSDFLTYRTGHPFVFSITFGASIDL